MKLEQTECSETSAFKIQTPGKYPEEYLPHLQHGESLKTVIYFLHCEFLDENASAVFSFNLATDTLTHLVILRCDHNLSLCSRMCKGAWQSGFQVAAVTASWFVQTMQTVTNTVACDAVLSGRKILKFRGVPLLPEGVVGFFQLLADINQTARRH
jgi:hypothetical protein